MDRLNKLSKDLNRLVPERSVTDPDKQQDDESPQIASNLLLRKGKYSYMILDESHWDKAVSLLAEGFIYNNPLNVAYFKLKSRPRQQLLSNQVVWWTKNKGQYINNISLMICDRDDQVVGVGLAKGFPSKGDQDVQCDDQSGKAQSALHDELKKRLPAEVKQLLQQKGKVLQLSGGVLAPMLLKEGHFKTMLQLVVQQGKNYGFQYAYGFSTNSEGRRRFTQLGYDTLSQIDAHTFTFMEEIPYKLVEEKDRYPCIVLKKIK